MAAVGWACARSVTRSSRAVGVLAGILAAAGASIAGYLVAKRMLQIEYNGDPWVWIYGLAGGGLLVCFAGWLATRSVVNQPPVLTLRGAG